MNQLVVQYLTLLLVLGAGLEASKQTANMTPIDSKEDLRLSLRFQPTEIDFGSLSVGIAKSHKVTLVNENANRSVYLSSSQTPIFFASFMDTRVIAPLSNTTFDVVFLPRMSIIATDTLLVHTSFGEARLAVRGQGFECPYRLKPIVGIKAPLNAMLTPEIYMYNPHERPLQIIEIYSSGGQFQLELPSGLSSAPQALWEIPPHTTKPIIRIKFNGNNAGNHSAFIRIKIASQSSQSNNEDVLVVPVEFEILAEQGVYASNPIIDFGRLTNIKLKKPIQQKIKLQNSAEHSSLEEVSIVSSETLPPGLSFERSDGGILTLDTEIYNKTTSIDELVTLHTKPKDDTKASNIFTVRVRAEIFEGTLHFNRNASIFVSGADRSPSADRRTLSIRNDFEGPLVIHNVSLDAALNQRTVEIKFGTEFPQVLQPQQKHDLLHLHFKDDHQTHFQTSIRIKTNITDFELPLIVCTGRLHVSTYHEPMLQPQPDYNTELNMGAVPLEEMSRYGYIVLQNPNPISVRVVNWNFKTPHGVYFHTTSLGCIRPAALTDLQANKNVAIESTNFRFCSALAEGDIMVFQIAIQSHVTELQMATLQIWTPHETITTTVLFHTWVGRLEVDQEELYFKNCFPGKICSSDLSIRSTFQHPIHITAINFTDDSIRFPSDESKNLVYALTPNAVTKLGRIYFEPAVHCHNRCYLSQDEKFNSLAFPATTLIENNNFHFDETELRRRTDLYRQMKRHFRTINFMITSRELRQVQLQAIIDIKWPKLVVEGAQKMLTIEAGKFQEHIIRIRNPLDRPILVEYFLANPAFARQTKPLLLVEVVDPPPSACVLTDQAVFTLKTNLQQQKQPILLKPRANLDVVVRFDAPPLLADTFCTLLHIRNNLTLYEAVWISAKSVQSQFRFGNRKPGMPTPLLYEIHDKHLTACQHQQPVILKRSFTARNTGEVPIRIDLFKIDDQVCEGYGFKVFGCGYNKGFELKANESRKIEIAFRPDFTLFRVTRTLNIVTNLSYDINYTLHGQLPPADMLRQCTDVMARPSWEKHIRISGVLLLLTSFVLVLAAANVDADNIGSTQSALYAAREKGAIQPTFNLRNIAIKANSQTSNSKSGKFNNSSGNMNCNRSQNKIHINNNTNSHQQQQHKNTRRRTAALTQSGNSQRKSSASTLDANFDEKFIFDDFEDAYDCSPSSSSNSGSFKSSPSPPKNAEERVITVDDKREKKQKTPPIGKLKSSNRKGAKTTQTTPPPTRNPIIELMDKDVGECSESITAEKSNATKFTKPKAEHTLLKRITESIAAAVSHKEKVRTSDKARVKAQRLEDNTKEIENNVCEAALDHTNEPKAQAKVNANPSQPKVEINAETQQPPSKPKAQDLLTNALKPRTTTTTSATMTDGNVGAKSSNYVGPIRNMESYQNQKAQPTDIPETTANRQTSAKASCEPRNRSEQLATTTRTLPLDIQASAATSTINSAVVKPMSLNNATGAQPLKYSKTPGRERSRDNNLNSTTQNSNNQISNDQNSNNQNSNNQNCNIQNSSNNNSIKNVDNDYLHEQKLQNPENSFAKQKVVKTLNFDEDNYSYAPMNNQRYALEQQQPIAKSTSLATNTPTYVDSEKGVLYIDLKATKQTKLSDNFCADSLNSNALPPEKSSNALAKSISNIFKECSSQVQQPQHKTTELGPIGTKKSPSSTPVWESIVGGGNAAVGSNICAPLQQPKVLDTSGNNSFFTNLATTTTAAAVGSQSTKTDNAMTAARGNIISSSSVSNDAAANFDFNAAQSILGNVNTASFFELKKAQVQLQRQLEANEYFLHLRSKQLQEEFRQRQQQELLKNITQWPRTSNVTSNEVGATWGPIGGVYGNNNVAVPLSGGNNDAKKSLTPTLDQFDAWPMTTNTAAANVAPIRPPPGLGGNVPTPPGLGQQQHNSNVNNSNANSPDDGVRTFDPFSSLGSIWSDSWKQTGNNNHQQQ